MKLKRNYIILVLINLLLIIMFSVYNSNAQNIKGIVLDEKLNKPLSGVNVFIKKSGIGTTTNDKGEFIFKYFAEINENDTLSFSIIGYVTKRIPLSDLKGNKNIVLLAESVQLLNEVTISAKKQLKLQIPYTKLASLKDGLYSFGSELIVDKIWVIGGDETWTSKKSPFFFTSENYSGKQNVYDIQTDKWTTSKLKFIKRAYHNIHFYNDKIYVLGGKTLSTNRRLEYLNDKIEVYDIKRNTILIDNTNPHQAVNFASFVFEDNLIVMGGSTKINITNEKVYSSKVHLLNLKTGFWYELKDMPVAKETKGVLINNTIYLIGGFNYKPLDNIETYNIATSEWKVLGQLFYGVKRPALAYNDSIIYIFENGRLQTYNIETKVMNMYSIDLPLTYCELFYADNKLYILGGRTNDEFSISASSDFYSIYLNELNRTVIYNTKTL